MAADIPNCMRWPRPPSRTRGSSMWKITVASRVVHTLADTTTNQYRGGGERRSSTGYLLKGCIGGTVAELPEHEAKSVRQYVEAETRDKKNRVKLVQKVGSRRVAGRSYEIYDVWMEKGDRWWVITNLTNLYSQDNFNSIQQAFTYHIGFNVVAGERFRPDED